MNGTQRWQEKLDCLFFEGRYAMNGTQRWQEKLDCLFFEGRYDQTIVCERVRKTDYMFRWLIL